MENVTHIYDAGRGVQVGALMGVNLNLAKGEFVAVIGRNGSGKSTLAKHLNALLLPTSGSVWVKGLNTADPEHLWKIRQTVGMVFQNPDNQIVATTVEEDVAFGPENLGIEPREIRRRVDEALAVVGMEDYKSYAPHLLSGGQKQRVAIAGVVAMRPECIVLDEPTAMLDPVGREEVIGTVRKLNKDERITVVYITHFMNEAALAGRVIVMEEGGIAMQGSPREIFSQVDALRVLHLDVPQVTELTYELNLEGVGLSPGILTIGEMVEGIMELRGDI